MTFYGYTDSMAPAQKALVEKRLTTHGRYTGVSYRGRQYTYPEYIRLLVKQGGDFIARKGGGRTAKPNTVCTLKAKCPAWAAAQSPIPPGIVALS